MAESLRSEDIAYSVEDYRHGVIGDGAQTWHWRLHSYKPLTNSQRNANLEPDKSSLGVTKSTKK